MERRPSSQHNALAEARRRGYLVNRRLYDEAECAWRERCRRERRPLVVVTLHGRTASGLLDFDTTERLSPDPEVGLVGEALSEAGAQLIRERFDKCQAPRVKLMGAYTGSTSVEVAGVPRSEADTLGEVLAAAAIACEPADGVSVLGVNVRAG